jgi:hypothetical protein
MARTFRLLAVLGLLFLPLACGSAPTLSYTVGPCQESAWSPSMQNRVEVFARGSDLYLEQDVAYVCCARIALRLESEGNLLKVIETNEGEVCRCMCAYHVSARVSGLARGRYRVQVWGIQYQDIHPLELLGEETVDL